MSFRLTKDLELLRTEILDLPSKAKARNDTNVPVGEIEFGPVRQPDFCIFNPYCSLYFRFCILVDECRI